VQALRKRDVGKGAAQKAAAAEDEEVGDFCHLDP
jgi:hypothetical protein